MAEIEDTALEETLMLPTFLIIGAMKSGTTSLYHYLKQHPDVYMPPKKEPGYFLHDDGETVAHMGPQGRRINSSRISKLADYQALFDSAGKQKARGEATVFYLYTSGAPDRIRARLPQVELFVILRNPVERAYSAFLQQVRDGTETHTDFAEALRAEPKRIAEGWGSQFHYREVGFYSQQLQRYYAAFNPEKLHVYLYDDLRRDPKAVMQSIFGILDVDVHFEADASVEHNISGIPKNRALQQLHFFLKGSNRSSFKELGKQLLPETLRHRIKGQITRTLETKNLTKPPLAPDVRQDLLRGYRQDILELQTLIGRDLHSWL